MNVYEQAHNLSKAIKESQEYKTLKLATEKIKTQPEIEKMLKEFIEKQMEIQTKQMLGQECDTNMEEVQKISAIVMQNPVANEYLQCQMRFSIMVQDVYKILGETVAVMQL